ncbi:MAG: head GIN domain-containing protein [Bacteroidota bacterium]
MKTSSKLLWALLSLIIISIFSMATIARIDLKEIQKVDGNGIVSSKRISMDHFNGFTLTGDIRARYVPDSTFAIVIRTDSNLHRYVSHKIYSYNWAEIGLDRAFGEATQLDLEIHAPTLQGFNAQNSAEIYCDSLLEQHRLQISVRNSSHIELFVNTDELHLNSHNSSSIKIKGQTEDLELEVNNSSQIDASDLIADFANVEANGSGKAKVHVRQRLMSHANAGGSVVYQGPESLTVKASGRGTTLPAQGNQSSDEALP